MRIDSELAEFEQIGSSEIHSVNDRTGGSDQFYIDWLTLLSVVENTLTRDDSYEYAT